MNLKSLIAVAGVSVVMTGFASITATNTLCRIAVNSGTKDTIVAIPLVDVGSDGTTEAINVTNFVLTTGLKNGTTLQYKSGSTWYNWALTSDGGAWEAAAGDAAATIDTFDRGGAVLLRRAGDDYTTVPFYLFGQYANTSKTQTPTAGTSSTPAYTLMGNAAPTSFSINADDFWTTSGSPTDGDQIVIPSNSDNYLETYTWKNSSWCTYSVTTSKVEVGGRERTTTTASWTTASRTIPAGQGFWYVSKGSTVPTVTW